MSLSPAEVEILSLVIEGRSHAAIAEIRGTSPGTVKKQAQHICRKLKARSLVDAARIALLQIGVNLPEGASPSWEPRRV